MEIFTVMFVLRGLLYPGANPEKWFHLCRIGATTQHDWKRIIDSGVQRPNNMVDGEQASRFRPYRPVLQASVLPYFVQKERPGHLSKSALCNHTEAKTFFHP